MGAPFSTDVPLSAQIRLEFSPKVPVFVPVHFQAGLLDGPTTVLSHQTNRIPITRCVRFAQRGTLNRIFSHHDGSDSECARDDARHECVSKDGRARTEFELTLIAERQLASELFYLNGTRFCLEMIVEDHQCDHKARR